MLLVQMGEGKFFMAESVGQDPIFPDKAKFVGVQGVREGLFPEFTVTTMSVNKMEVGAILEGGYAAKATTTGAPVAGPKRRNKQKGGQP